MATEYATDVEMQSFDFSSFLRENTYQRSLFPFIADQGPVEPVLISKKSVGIFGESSPTNMIAALKTAQNNGNHWGVRVTSEDSRFSAVLVGIFTTNGETGKPFLGIAPLNTIADNDLSPVYRNGGLPLSISKFNVQDAIDEGGTDVFRANGMSVRTHLVTPLALLYRNGTGKEGDNYSVSIISENAYAIPPVAAATVVEGGNLKAGTYTYLRVPVTAKGEQPESKSTEVTVTITAADVAAGRRAVKLNWNIDDIAVRGVMIYRTYSGASSPVPTTGRLAELQRNRLSVLDDTFNIGVASSTDNTSTRIDLETNFMLEVRKGDAVVENINFSFSTELAAYNAAPIDDAINLGGSEYLKALRLYDTDLVQSVDTLICYSTPTVQLAGGFDGANPPTVEDLERALVPFLNRDRYRVSAIVDLGWCSPAASAEFAKVEAEQRAHSLLSVPYGAQTAQGAVAYAASLPTGSRRSSIYTPWMYRRDEDTGAKRLIPPAAFAAQCMHQSDSSTPAGAGRSFAGLNRGVTDAIGVENPDKYEYDDTERDLMARGLVNYFRRKSPGMVLWEDWTLQRNITAASYVSVSRLWDIIQNSINDFLEYRLKEPNDSYATTEIVAGLNEYLKGHVRARNLGNFEVVADGRAGNNSTTADQGIRNIDVYLTPVIPTRRFRCRTILTRQGVSYSDLMQAV